MRERGATIYEVQSFRTILIKKDVLRSVGSATVIMNIDI